MLLLPLLALALLAASGSCAAQTVIHHCTAPDGTPVFTDRSCASLGDIPATSQANPLSPRSPAGPQRCPMDVKSLKKRVAAAFRAHNANALAGLMLWRGYHERNATRIVQQLAQLMHWSFLGFAHAGEMNRQARRLAMAPPWKPSSSLPTTPPGTLTLRLTDPTRPSVSFRIIHRDGCLWLEPGYTVPSFAGPAMRIGSHRQAAPVDASGFPIV